MRIPVECLIECYKDHLFGAAFSVTQNVADAQDASKTHSFDIISRLSNSKTSNIFVYGFFAPFTISQKIFENHFGSETKSAWMK
ncbi:hypothetical protein C815_01139 [Firmicutes bacterium M10-2]|nr:hypothetical protein C815_01139 [Firmicutes bacterium M10-2]